MSHVNRDMELAICGSAMMHVKAVELAHEHGLRAKHFMFVDTRHLWEVINRLHDRGEPIDPVTVAHNCDAKFVPLASASLKGELPTPPRIKAWCEDLIDLHRWRTRDSAAAAMRDAIERREEDRFWEAHTALGAEWAQGSETQDPEQLATSLYEYLDSETELFSWPFYRLDDLTSGGMRRGEVSLIGGWSSHGKSVFLDQCLELQAKSYRVHLYINEMKARDRAARFVARESGVLLQNILRNKLDADQTKRVVDAMARIPYPVTDAAGWTVTDITRHMRHLKADVIGVDILHLIDHRDERDVAAISRALNVAAKRCDCHILATVHLNENRVMGQTRPMPTLGDIRGSGMLKNDADNVLFVFREQDADTGFPQEESRIYLAKARSGVTGGVECSFDGAHMRFTPRPAPWRQAA